MDIIWTGDELLVAGPDTALVTARMPRAAALVGVRFEPGAASAWLRVSAADLVNSRPPLEAFWGRRATEPLADRLAEAENPTVAAAMLEDALLGRTSLTGLSALAMEAGYADQAHLAREVRRLSGLTPRGLMAELRS